MFFAAEMFAELNEMIVRTFEMEGLVSSNMCFITESFLYVTVLIFVLFSDSLDSIFAYLSMPMEVLA